MSEFSPGDKIVVTDTLTAYSGVYTVHAVTPKGVITTNHRYFDKQLVEKVNDESQ